MGKPTVDPSPHTIIDVYRNAPMASGYHAGIYLVRNEAEPDNPSLTSEAAYSQIPRGDNHDSC